MQKATMIAKKQEENGIPGFEVSSKIWFHVRGQHFFGLGMARILSAVEDTGSLLAAAKREKISYRQAWKKIKIAEERLGAKLISSWKGGADGGGSYLTGLGKEMLALFSELSSRVAPFTDSNFRHLRQKNDFLD